MEIKRLGSYAEVDEQGYLQGIGDASNIQGEWLEAAQVLKGAYLEQFGNAIHSIYIRGSLAKGLAVKGISDLDSFAVMQPTWENTVTYDALKAWMTGIEQSIQTAFPFVAGIEVGLDTFGGLDRENPYTFIIKVEAACVYGQNLTEIIEPYKVDATIAFQTEHFHQHLDLFRKTYPNESEEEKPAWLTWLMRRFLRLGMELVMIGEQRYTRDLFLCYESFAKHYPEKEREMYRALELAINPVTGQETERFIDNFGLWLAQEADRFKRSHGVERSS